MEISTTTDTSGLPEQQNTQTMNLLSKAKNQEQNLEVQHLAASNTSLATSEALEPEVLDIEQNTTFMDTNSDDDAKVDTPTHTTPKKKNNNKSKKKELDYVKTSGPIRKKDLISDKDTPGGRHQEY
jgi:hypothetical protein